MARRVASLLRTGIRTFIDLTEEGEINENAKPVPAYYPLLRQAVEEECLDLSYFRCPVPDRGVPSVWMMRGILDLIDRSLADENPAYVHCWAGRGRTGTVVACHLKRHGRAPEADVTLTLAELRKGMPRRPSSPHTPGQIRMANAWKPGA